MDIAIFGTADAGYIQALNQLAGKTIVVCKNRAAENYFRQMHPELHLLTVPTVSEGILALRRGEAYCMVESVLPMTHALMEKGDASLRIIGDVPFVCEQRLAIRKDWPVLLGILDEALDQVSLEEQQAFKRKWMSIQVQQPPDYSLVYKIGIPIVAFLLLSLYWNRKYLNYTILIYVIPILVAASLDMSMEGVQYPVVYYLFLGYLLSTQQKSKIINF